MPASRCSRASALGRRDGPLLRFFGLGNHGFVIYRDLGELEGAELDALIARQVHLFAEPGERFEWKLAAGDRPELTGDSVKPASGECVRPKHTDFGI